MPTRRSLLPLLPALLLGACAGWPGREPVRVTVAGLEPLPGQGLELRFLVKLRVQNPSDAPIAYDGIALALELRGLPFASGVSDASGSVPRFGEAVLGVPVTVSALQAVRQAIGLLGAASDQRALDYRLTGKLAGPGLGTVPFESRGELAWPEAVRP